MNFYFPAARVTGLSCWLNHLSVRYCYLLATGNAARRVQAPRRSVFWLRLRRHPAHCTQIAQFRNDTNARQETCHRAPNECLFVRTLSTSL